MHPGTVTAILRIRSQGIQSNLGTVILVLLDEGSMFMTDLASLTEESYQTTWHAAKTLIGLGLIDKYREPNETKPRLRLTPKGRGLF